ncbi:head-tail connector protein [Zhenhengia yiwuensis]|uniref:Phage gp6-like head-tail connector protein n=1 Tax=Zhenhengia yiwuensis TaxID=2763666 RepID=A0A926I8X0_9FIRM|nr:head-tail connector protein [Zhenhengia yiwuensis]MBC8579140.1 phage gp6-like head-tail connector protein [Zhenhengia yiwuensis]
MKISEINLDIAKEYLRQDDDSDDRIIQLMLDSAKSYVVNFTGTTMEQLDEQEDICLAVLLLLAEFYDNRTIAINDKLNLRFNEMLVSLLGRHSINLL